MNTVKNVSCFEGVGFYLEDGNNGLESSDAKEADPHVSASPQAYKVREKKEKSFVKSLQINSWPCGNQFHLTR